MRDSNRKSHRDQSIVAEKLAQISLEIGSKLIHISTDHLYDGTKNIYAEEDVLSPLNVYGKTKLKQKMRHYR